MEISLRRMSLCNLLFSWQFTFQISPPQGAVSFFVEHRFHRLYRFLYPSFFQSKGIPPLLFTTPNLIPESGMWFTSPCFTVSSMAYRFDTPSSLTAFPKKSQGGRDLLPLCSLLHKTIALIWGGGSMGIAAVVNHDTVKPHP